MISVLIDERMPDEGQRALMLLGARVITLPPLNTLPEAIASHPDTLIARIGKRLITSADYCDRAAYIFSDLREYHPMLSVTFASDVPGARYPDDARFNALVTGGRIFVNTKNISDAVIAQADKEGLATVHVNQGYPACATLSPRDGVAITADPGLARVLRQNGIDVLEIKSGGIDLPPYEYGFIGGACCVIGDKVYFFGDPTTHPSGKEITEFLADHGIGWRSLFGGRLIDLGGATVIQDDAE